MAIDSVLRKQDMTTGKPWKKILLFSIPLLVGNVAQQLYSTVDSIVVGKFVGDDALAAVGSSMPLQMMIMVFFITLGTGSSVMVSQYYGAKDRKKLSMAIGNTITWTFIISLFLMIVGPIVAEPLLRLINTPARYLQWSKDYLIIALYGVSGLAFYNIFSGILRGLGDSISSLIYVLVATVLNIVLDLLFVAVFKWGVAGVAIATVLSQFVSSVLAFQKLRTYKDFEIRLSDLKPTLESTRHLFRIGVPSGLTQSTFSLAMLFVQSLTNKIDIAAISTMVMRVDGFAMLPNFTFGIAMSTYAGQNIGAGKFERLQEGRKQGLTLGLTTTTLLTALIIIFGKDLMHLFSNTQSNIDLAYNMMLVLAVGYLAFTVTQVLAGIMRGAGDTITSMWITISNTVIVRVPLAYLIAYLTRNAEWPHGQPIATFGSLVITWITGSILTSIFFARGKWRNKALVKPPIENMDLERSIG